MGLATKHHVIWSEKGHWVEVNEDPGWFETLSKWFAGFTYFGGLGIGSGEVAETLGLSDVIGAGIGGEAAESIPLENLGNSLFSHENVTQVPDGHVTTTDVDFITPDHSSIIEPRDEVVASEFNTEAGSPGHHTSTPTARGGRPNINRQPNVYEGELEIEENIDEEPLVISSRGSGKSHEVVYTRAKPTGTTRSGRTLKSLFYRPVSQIGNEIEMEPLIEEEEEGFSGEYDGEEDLVFDRATYKPKDGTNWGRWRRGNWSFGYKKGGGFHLKYKTAPVRWRGNKISVRENGKWVSKEIPKTVVNAINVVLPDKKVNHKRGGKGKGRSPLVPYQPGHSSAKDLTPAYNRSIVIETQGPTIHHKKRHCIKKRKGKCVKYSM